MKNVVRHLVIRGHVQGVGFRYSLFYAAQNFKVTGWVRNRRDGSVEAMAQGPESEVQAFIDWCRKGPELARVDEVDVTEGSAGDFSEFSIKDTA